MRIFVVKKNTLIRAGIFLLLIIGAIVYTQVALNDAAPAASMSEPMPICRVNTEDKAVALTIDTAFGDADYTQDILKVLDNESAKATFFVMGLWANDNPEALEAISKSGNEIASHSMNHGRYPDMTADEVIADAGEAKTMLFDKTGFDTQLIRMPYGAFDTESIMTLEGDGYIPVKWSLDAKDWKGYDSAKIADGVLNTVKSGDIIMFQNNMPASPAALAAVILGLREQGFKIMTVSDLLLDGDAIVDATGTQRYFED
jgi:peptidoglycan/xylan/chitin deacetylase (PgdA/CDA1 family)